MARVANLARNASIIVTWSSIMPLDCHRRHRAVGPSNGKHWLMPAEVDARIRSKSRWADKCGIFFNEWFITTMDGCRHRLADLNSRVTAAISKIQASGTKIGISVQRNVKMGTFMGICIMCQIIPKARSASYLQPTIRVKDGRLGVFTRMLRSIKTLRSLHQKRFNDVRVN